MSATLSSNNFGDKLYNSLPEVYRKDDISVNYALKRYLQCLSDGGYSYVIEEINNLMNLVDPEKIDKSLLYLLFKAYGLEIFNGIPELYLRKLMPSVSDLFALKGSITAIEYLTSLITGVKVEIDVTHFPETHTIKILLEMDYEAEGRGDFPNLSQIHRIIKEFLPFYVDSEVIFVYIFYETALLRVIDDYDTDRISFIYNENSKFKLLNMSLLNKEDSLLTNNFILNDDGWRSNLPRDFDYYFTDLEVKPENNTGGLSLNDTEVYDTIYINGELSEIIEY